MTDIIDDIKVRESDSLYGLAVNNDVIHSIMNNTPSEKTILVPLFKPTELSWKPTNGNFWFDLC